MAMAFARTAMRQGRQIVVINYGEVVAIMNPPDYEIVRIDPAQREEVGPEGLAE